MNPDTQFALFVSDLEVWLWCATLDIDNELDNWYAGGDT